jgi:hypothetical protein
VFKRLFLANTDVLYRKAALFISGLWRYVPAGSPSKENPRLTFVTAPGTKLGTIPNT